MMDSSKQSSLPMRQLSLGSPLFPTQSPSLHPILADARFPEILKIMDTNRVNYLPVIDITGQIVDAVTIAQIVALCLTMMTKEELEEYRFEVLAHKREYIQNCASTEVSAALRDTTLMMEMNVNVHDALTQMVNEHVRAIFVVQEKIPMRLITFSSLLRCALHRKEELKSNLETKISEISNCFKQVWTIKQTEMARQAFAMMIELVFST
eukprot:TRINITY_DN7751_c0_g1_i2.p1 TRINITY_DN7751_c0_g1~~TRINITY_DN7751_c0_g1_i2.p1  ORF type:complete len:209 (-),score=61.71 TRINITY_DN7751_c0_g1_i2:279-905(-)